MAEIVKESFHRGKPLYDPVHVCFICPYMSSTVCCHFAPRNNFTLLLTNVHFRQSAQYTLVSNKILSTLSYTFPNSPFFSKSRRFSGAHEKAAKGLFQTINQKVERQKKGRNTHKI